MDGDGTPQGFNVELMKLLAREAGFEVEFRLGRWRDVMDSFDAGEIDVMSLAYSESWAERYDFLTQTWSLTQSFVFAPGRDAYPRSVLELADEVVAVEERGGIHEQLTRLPENASPELLLVRNQEFAFQAVRDGRATANGSSANSEEPASSSSSSSRPRTRRWSASRTRSPTT
jgi:ABC-type amino acid transport substrate-binding protein